MDELHAERKTPEAPPWLNQDPVPGFPLFFPLHWEKRELPTSDNELCSVRNLRELSHMEALWINSWLFIIQVGQGLSLLEPQTNKRVLLTEHSEQPASPLPLFTPTVTRSYSSAKHNMTSLIWHHCLIVHWGIIENNDIPQMEDTLQGREMWQCPIYIWEMSIQECCILPLWALYPTQW